MRVYFVFCREDERRTAFFVTPIIKGFYEKLCLRFLLICQVKYLLKTVFFLGFLDACITQFPNRTMLGKYEKIKKKNLALVKDQAADFQKRFS